MKIANKFSIFIVLPSILVDTLLYASEAINYQIFLSVLIAAILGSANLYMATILFKYSIKKSSKKFLNFNLGGMAIRLFVNILIVLFVLNFLNIDKDAFILVFFIFYFIGISFEIVFFYNFSAKK